MKLHYTLWTGHVSETPQTSCSSSRSLPSLWTLLATCEANNIKENKTKTIGFVGKKTYKVRVIGSNTPKKAFGTILTFDWFVGTYIAQWWECAPPTTVAWVRFPDLVSHVGWVCCWFSSSRKTNPLNSTSTWTPWKRRATSC